MRYRRPYSFSRHHRFSLWCRRKGNLHVAHCIELISSCTIKPFALRFALLFGWPPHDVIIVTGCAMPRAHSITISTCFLPWMIKLSKIYSTSMVSSWVRSSLANVQCFLSFAEFFKKLLVGASICRTYGKTAEDLLWKIQSINFTSSGPRSEFKPITMDTLFEAKKSYQLELTNAASRKPKVKQHTAAVIDRSKLPNQKFALKGSAAVKQEHPAASTSIAPSGIVTTSNVAFVGQLNDPESRKKRRCEININLPFLESHD